MSTINKIRFELKKKLTHEFQLNFTMLTDQTDLLNGSIDSFGYLRLLQIIDETVTPLGLTIEPENLFSNGQISVDSLCNFFESKLDKAAST